MNKDKGPSNDELMKVDAVPLSYNMLEVLRVLAVERNESIPEILADFAQEGMKKHLEGYCG